MSNKIYASVGYGIRLTDEGPGGFNLGNANVTLGKLYPDGSHGLCIEFHEVRGGPKYHEPMLLIESNISCKEHGWQCMSGSITSTGDAADDLTRFLATVVLHKEEWDARIAQCVARFKEQGFFPSEEIPHPIMYIHMDDMT